MYLISLVVVLFSFPDYPEMMKCPSFELAIHWFFDFQADYPYRRN